MQIKKPLIVTSLIIAASGVSYWVHVGGPATNNVPLRETHVSVSEYNHIWPTKAKKSDDSELNEMNWLVNRLTEEVLLSEDSEILQDDQLLPVTLWQPADQLTVEGMLVLPEDVSEKIAINLDSQEIDVIATGDSISFILPGNHSFEAVIQATTFNSNGDKTLTGHISGATSRDGSSYPVLITQGKTTSFATITTPYGSYSMETVNGQGWIYKNPPRSMLETVSTDAISPDGDALLH